MKRFRLILFGLCVLALTGCWAKKEDAVAHSNDVRRWVSEYTDYSAARQEKLWTAVCRLEKIAKDAGVLTESLSQQCPDYDPPDEPPPPCEFGNCPH